MQEYKVKEVILKDGHRKITIIKNDYPHALLSQYLLEQSTKVATNTLKNQAFHLCHIFSLLDRYSINLSRCIKNCHGISSEEIWVIVHQLGFNEAGLIANRKTKIQKINTMIKLVNWLRSNSIFSKDKNKSNREINDYCDSIIQRIRLAKPISSCTPNSKGYDYDIVEILKRLTPTNSQDSNNNVRNYLLVAILAHTAMRVGELLSLQVQDIEFGSPLGICIEKRENDLTDPRSRPAAVKRNARKIPLWHRKTAELLHTYIYHIRTKIVGFDNEKHQFIFVTEQGKPISHAGVLYVFQQIKKTQKIKGRFHPHSLRHKASSYIYQKLLDENYSEDAALKILMAIRGDSNINSSQIYINETIEKESEKILNIIQLEY